jgi:hypothetical protein
MEISWKYIKALESKSLIDDFERTENCRFDDAFKACVRENNGGRPSVNTFDTDRAKGRAMKSLLSFNPSDRANIREVNEVMKDAAAQYIAFASDNFGNLICFERESGRVVFQNHETGEIESVAPDFKAFMENLYAIE